jgi:hypothetical protein
MQAEVVRDQLRAVPFRPFRIVLATGETLAVRHPEMLALGGRTAVLIDEDDRTHFVDVGLVIKLESDAPAPAGQIREEKEG